MRRRLKEVGLPWQLCLKKLPLTDEQKADAVQWGKVWAKKSASFWQNEVLAMDCKMYPWYTSAKGRVLARRATKVGAYTEVGKRIKKPSKRKHRRGNIAIPICAGVGAGKIIMWTLHETPWCAEAYSHIVSRHLSRAVKLEGDKKLLVLRDNDPKGFESKRGQKAEQKNGLTIIKLPKYRSDLMPLDYSVWDNIHKRMIFEEQGWPKSKRETKKEYIARLKQTALDTPKAEMDKCMASMRRRCRALVDSGGDWTKGD